jgi:hypothetical protein
LVGIVGVLLGATAGWLLPNAIIPHPHQFDFLAIIGWRMMLVPLGAILGLLLGLSVGKQPPPRRILVTYFLAR